MPTFRLTLLLAYGLAVLTAGLPARGFAWCLRDDGVLRVEATAADGRCADADADGHMGTAEPGAGLAYHPASGLLPCVDLTSDAGPLGACGEFATARLASAAPVLIATLFPTVWTTPDADTHRAAEPAVGPPLAAADTTHIRKTVSLLV